MVYVAEIHTAYKVMRYTYSSIRCACTWPVEQVWLLTMGLWLSQIYSNGLGKNVS